MMATIDPTFDATEADALDALAGFIAGWMAADPVRGKALPGATALGSKLRSAAAEIRGSSFYVNTVTLDQDELNALVFAVRLFASSAPDHPAHVRLNRWVEALEAAARPIIDYDVSRSAWQYATKMAKSILVVSGRNRKAHNELVLWLKHLHLNPVLLDASSAHGSATTPEALEASLAACGTGIVLATPDDEGRLSVDEDGRALPPGKREKLHARARQNVVMELGMLWGHIGRERIILLLEQSVTLGTDTAGFMTIRFDRDVRLSFEDLRRRLQAMGIITVKASGQ